MTRAWRPGILRRLDPAVLLRSSALCGDLVGACVGVGLALAVSGWFKASLRGPGPAPGWLERDLLWASLVMLAWLALSGLNGAYATYNLHQTHRALRVLVATTGEALTLYLLAFVALARPLESFTLLTERAVPPDLLSTAVPRLVPLVALAVTVVLALLGRAIVRRLGTLPAFRRDTVLLWNGTDGSEAGLTRVREMAGELGVLLVALGSTASADDAGLVVDDGRDGGRPVAWAEVDQVIVPGLAWVDPDLMAACRSRGVPVRSLGSVFEDVRGCVPVVASHGEYVEEALASTERPRALYEAAKRAVDVVVAAAGLTLAGLAFPFVALAIRWDSPGPVFYSQVRLGRGGRRFRLYKFRTMTADAEVREGPRWATPDDPRVTAGGRWLRRTRLDEVPQLWNVLRGEMSLVGPRPERPAFAASLSETIPFHGSRLAVKPGVTGWAQVNHPYANSVVDARTKLEYDLYYVKHRSATFDALVMFRTGVMLFTFAGY